LNTLNKKAKNTVKQKLAFFTSFLSIELNVQILKITLVGILNFKSHTCLFLNPHILTWISMILHTGEVIQIYRDEYG